MKEVTVLAPATVANVVCGFDVMGFALEEPNDLMTLRKIPERTVKIINRDEFDLPTEPTRNVAGATLLSILEKAKVDFGFAVEITKTIKPGSGIGSSAASAAGAAVAANLLLENQFTKQELVDFASDGERVASGARHADNVAPCIYGGFTLVRSSEPLDIVPLGYPPLFVTILHPQIEVKTSDAREILKQKILLKDAIRQWGNVAALVAGLLKNDYDLIARSLDDRIIEPIRSILIPRFANLKIAAKNAGALGGGISGSGPSIFMLSRDEQTARAVEKAMQQIYQSINLNFASYVTKINSRGVRVKS